MDVSAGVAELVGTNVELIVDRATALLQGSEASGSVLSPYGDGLASSRIVEVLKTGALTDSFSATPARDAHAAAPIPAQQLRTGT